MAADRAVSLRIINSTRRKRLMDELLSSVLNAYGGLDNWSHVTTLTVKLELGGPFWAARGWPGVYADQTVILDPHRERIALIPFPPFTAPARPSVLEVDPERVVIQTADGGIVEERTEPRRSFPTKYDFA